MSKISEEAANKMQEWVSKHGLSDDKALLDYAYALTTHYGEAISALSCQMYEATASAQGVTIKSAEAVETPTYGEVAKGIHGALKSSQKKAPSEVGRLVKRIGADTTLKNAERDGAQFAWIPHGDTCAYCIAIASRGWQYMSKNALKNGHAEHIHPNCDCQYAVRFDGSSNVEGYDPDKYLEMYNNAAPGGTPQEKINALRRQMEEQKRQVNLDTMASVKSYRYTGFAAYKVKESRYGVYLSENANKKAQNLSNIEKALDTATKKLGIENKNSLPKIFVLSQEEMGDGTFAAYNAVKNELYLSDVNGNKRKTISAQKILGFASPESPDSTVRHELIHWGDAQTYRETGTINNTEEYQIYLKKSQTECKMKLDEIGITEDNVNTISDYAEASYVAGKYDEVYTEYRVAKGK
jgi:hypothetical protein